MSEHAFLSVICRDRTKISASSFGSGHLLVVQGESAPSVLVKARLQ